MSGCIIICKSSTEAQRAVRYLKRNKVESSVVRTLVKISEKPCSYGAKIAQKNLSESVKILKDGGIAPVSVIIMNEDGSYKTVKNHMNR